MAWPNESIYALRGDSRSHPYLADDDAAKADNHSFAGDLTAYHEAPALIEHLKKLA